MADNVPIIREPLMYPWTNAGLINEEVVITLAAQDYVAGTVLELDVLTGKYVPALVASTNFLGKAILAKDITATAGDNTAYIYTDGYIKPENLVFADGGVPSEIEAASLKAQLKINNIYVRDVLGDEL